MLCHYKTLKTLLYFFRIFSISFDSISSTYYNLYWNNLNQIFYFVLLDNISTIFWKYNFFRLFISCTTHQFIILTTACNQWPPELTKNDLLLSSAKHSSDTFTRMIIIIWNCRWSWLRVVLVHRFCPCRSENNLDVYEIFIILQYPPIGFPRSIAHINIIISIFYFHNYDSWEYLLIIILYRRTYITQVDIVNITFAAYNFIHGGSSRVRV